MPLTHHMFVAIYERCTYFSLSLYIDIDWGATVNHFTFFENLRKYLIKPTNNYDPNGKCQDNTNDKSMRLSGSQVNSLFYFPPNFLVKIDLDPHKPSLKNKVKSFTALSSSVLTSMSIKNATKGFRSLSEDTARPPHPPAALTSSTSVSLGNRNKLSKKGKVKAHLSCICHPFYYCG